MAEICVGEFTVKVELTLLNRTSVIPVNPVPLMMTVAPTRPLKGEKLVTVNPEEGPVSEKLVELVAVPALVITEIAPVAAPTGTMAVIEVVERTLKDELTPLNWTSETPVKLEPVIFTLVPTAPLVGVKFVTWGRIVKLVPLDAVPAEVVTLIGPAVARVGTVAVIDVSEFCVNEDAMPLNLTELAPVNPVPVIVTLVPMIPLVGVKLLIPGNTVKLDPLLSDPAGLETVILPFVAFAGRVASTSVEDTTVNGAGTPLKVTEVAMSKYEPVMETTVPAAPRVGVNREITGA